MTKLILGTAQFGSGYGITNQARRIPDDEMVAILRVAAEAGMDLFDTAPDYGDAQLRLGSFKSSGQQHYISKFRLPDEAESISADSLYGSSLEALQASKLYGLLFHRVGDLRSASALAAWDVLRRARDAGAISRIGASIYDAEDLSIVATRFPDLDIIQVPGNVVDRRLLDHATLANLHDQGVEVHVRSAYLQGLLLSTADDLPEYFQRLRPIVTQLRAHASEQNVSVLVLALGFLRGHHVVDGVLVGATSPDELASTIAAWETSAELLTDFDFDLPDLPDELLDPRLWPAREEKL